MSYRKPRSESIAVANGQQTQTGYVTMRDYVIAGVITPAALTSTAITFTGCGTPDGTYMDIYDSDGNQVSVAVAASRACGLSGAEADAVASFPFIKVVMGSAEGGDRTLTLCLK